MTFGVLFAILLNAVSRIYRFVLETNTKGRLATIHLGLQPTLQNGIKTTHHRVQPTGVCK